MTLHEFIYTFLPQLVNLFQQGQLPFHSLVDFELWQRIYPNYRQLERQEFSWNAISLNAFQLPDQTILLVYTLPEPMKFKETKFIGIRIDRKVQKAVYYLLQRPQFYDDQWDIFTLPNLNENKQYIQKIIGTWSLRDFVHTIETLPFKQNEEDNKTLFGKIFRDFFTTQPNRTTIP